MEVAKITVTDIGGTYRDVADAARTTIGLKDQKVICTKCGKRKVLK